MVHSPWFFGLWKKRPVSLKQTIPIAIPTMDYGLWTMDYGLWTMDYGLWTMDYGLWTMDYGLNASRSRIFLSLQRSSYGIRQGRE